MRKLEVLGGGRVGIIEYREPEPGPGEVVVETAISARDFR